MILPPEAMRRRVSRLQALIAYLDRLEEVDLSDYLKDIGLQLRLERVVQLMTQTSVDLAETIAAREKELRAPAPAAGAKNTGDENPVHALADLQVIERALADRLAGLPAFAAILTHEHVEIDPTRVWRCWREQRPDFSALASACSRYLASNKEFL